MIALAGAWLAALAGVVVVGPGTAHLTVAAGVARARPGDTVEVRPGVYAVARLRLTKPLTLLGPGDGTAVLDGGGEPILIVAAPEVTVRGLALRNVATSFLEDRAAILLDGATGCRIESNEIRDAFFGIYGAKSARCAILGNRILGPGRTQTESGNAIHLWNCREMDIRNNVASGHRDGIYFEFVRHATVRDNRSTGNNRYGLHFMFSDSSSYTGNTLSRNRAGVAVMYTRHVTMTGNRFDHAWGSAAYGLLLKDITDAMVTDNLFADNSTGLVAEGATRLVVAGNTFARNGWAVRVMANLSDGRFERNRFLGNTFDVTTNGRFTPVEFRENYWDAYTGYDLDRDGVGDVPFRPVRLFSILVARREPATILLRSFFANLLDLAERVMPVLTPETVVDRRPLMREPAA